jgi:hypothetical protein
VFVLPGTLNKIELAKPGNGKQFKNHVGRQIFLKRLKSLSMLIGGIK